MTTEELKKLEDNLWTAADNLRANSDLKSSEYSIPVLGIIFLKFADNRYSRFENEIKAEVETQKDSRKQRPIEDIAIEKCGFYLPPNARYDHLLNLSEETDVAKELKIAMQEIERYKPELRDTLPQDEYFRLTRNEKTKTLPFTLLRIFADIPKDASGDVFGHIYEYFLGEFALAEGQGGGEFFTPRSVVKLMVEIIEPYRGKLFDPACGSGGMFVQSSNYIDRRKKELHDTDTKDFFVYGCEKTLATMKLAKMNIAVNGLRGDIRQANSYYEDAFDSYGRFDFVMANPPFNVDEVSYDDVKNQRRFNDYGIPKTKSKGSKKKGEKQTVPNANYLWINLFATSLNEKGRAALVMANSASDARHSEYDIRKTLIQHGLIDVMVTMPSNMFTTVTLPATLWFFDKSKSIDSIVPNDGIDNKILFIDARNIYRQIDRARREFTDEQLQNLATIVRLRRGERNRFIELIHKYFYQIHCRLNGLMEETDKKKENSIAEHFQNCETLLIEFIDKISLWLENTKANFEEGQIQKMNAFGFEAKLNQFDVKNDSIALSDGIIGLYPAYQKQLHLDEIEKTNILQHDFRSKYETQFKNIKTKYNDLDRAFRHLEEAYQFAEKELKQNSNKLWKEIPSPKSIRSPMDKLNEAIANAYYFVTQIKWLQERFPEARYEDVTGLCKLASLDEIKEQDYSLNPGRYVGVVIEEDGITEEEYKENIILLNKELLSLNQKSKELENIIDKNINLLMKND